MKKILFVASAVTLGSTIALSSSVYAGEKKQFVIVNEDVGVPVFPFDIKAARTKSLAK